MKLLLKKDVPKLGIVGDVVEVSAGYARNFLIPQDLATTPTKGAIKALAAEREKAEQRRREMRERLQADADKLADVEVTIEAAANEDGVLYGSVGPREVAAALRDVGHDVSTAQLSMHDTIKHLDNVIVDVVLADDIKTTVKVWVVRSKASAEEEGVEDSGQEAEDRDEGYDEY